MGKPTLLIFGGSAGAVRLNTLLLEAASSFRELQLLHFTGSEQQAQEVEKRYKELQIKAYVRPFEPQIGLAMQAADCAIGRSGAATVCELIEYQLPALLIPYPFATNNHQEKNGEHFVSIVKGGKMYKEKELTPALLASTISGLLAEQHVLQERIITYKREREVQSFSELVKEIVERGVRVR